MYKLAFILSIVTMSCKTPQTSELASVSSGSMLFELNGEKVEKKRCPNLDSKKSMTNRKTLDCEFHSSVSYSVLKEELWREILASLKDHQTCGSTTDESRSINSEIKRLKELRALAKNQAHIDKIDRDLSQKFREQQAADSNCKISQEKAASYKSHFLNLQRDLEDDALVIRLDSNPWLFYKQNPREIRRWEETGTYSPTQKERVDVLFLETYDRLSRSPERNSGQ